jgi:hypothetical protein
MAVINLYTQAQVQQSLQRGLVSLLLISQKIQSDFLFFNTSIYNTYKNLQYDIYQIYTAVNNEQGFINYGELPNPYEENFYQLVGALVKKTKTIDVFGAYGGSLNPNYQAPNVIIDITLPELATFDLYKTDVNLLDAGGGNWYLPFLNEDGSALPSTYKPVLVTDNGVSFGYTFDGSVTPPRIYGFGNNSPTQNIVVTVVKATN